MWKSDFKQVVRGLGKSPVFTIMAVSTLALALGANTALFSVLDGIVLRPLPFERPHELVMIWQSIGTSRDTGMAPPDLRILRESSTTFSEIASTNKPTQLNLLVDGRPESVQGKRVSANLFTMLGVEAALGRTFRRGDDARGSEPVVVLDHDYWTSRFGADEDIIGLLLDLGAQRHRVVGVLPESFSFPLFGEQDLWVPRVFSEQEDTTGGFHSEVILGRLASGVTAQVADADLAQFADGLRLVRPVIRREMTTYTGNLQDAIVGDVEGTLYTLLGAVFVVLLLASANLANLTLARNQNRSVDDGLRLALGSGTSGLIRLRLLESAVLCLLGASLGILIAFLTIDGLLAAAPPGLPRVDNVRVDVRTVGFTLTAASATLLFFGLLPAYRSGIADIRTVLGGSSYGATTGSGAARLRTGLLTLQSGLVLVVLVMGGLFARSLWMVYSEPPGFETDGLITARVQLPSERYPDAPSIQAFFTQVLDRLRAEPGVLNAGAVSTLPLTGSAITINAPTPEDRAEAFDPGSPAVRMQWDVAAPGFFGAMGIPLISGRDFTDADRSDAPNVVILNQTLAVQLFGAKPPVGRRVAYGLAMGPTRWYEVVGVAGDVRHRGLDAAPFPTMYQPAGQITFAWPTMELVVQSAGGAVTGDQVRRAIRSVDSSQPIATLRTGEELRNTSLADRRFRVQILGIFSALALLLGLVGMYGIVAYTVGSRVREMGIRIALGAPPGVIRTLVLRGALIPVIAGIGIGLAVAYGLGGTFGAQLYKVDPHDATTLIAGTGIVLLVALVAAWFPARRAAGTSPVAALGAN